MAGNKDTFQKEMNEGHSAAWDQDWEKAAECYKLALEEFPNHPQALSSLGLAFFELQNFSAALECYQKTITVNPEDPMAQEKIGRIFERMGKLSDAVRASLRAAELHMKARSVEKAIDNWIRVLSFQPENTSVRTHLAAVYEKMGKKEEAVSEFISIASVFQHSGEIPKAVKYLEYALKIIPDSQEVRLALSQVKNNRSLPRPSRKHGTTGPMRMSQIRQMDGHEGNETYEYSPDPIDEARKKALVQLAANLFEQADDHNNPPAQSRGRGLTALTRGHSDSTKNNNERSQIILHLSQAIDSQTNGDNNQAAVELEHALNLGFRQIAAYFLLGLLSKEHNPDKALNYLQQSVKHPDYQIASNLLNAQIYEKNEQWNEAAASYLQALALADASVVNPGQVDDLLSQYDAIIDSLSSVVDPATHQATCQAISNQLNRANWRNYLLEARQNLTPTSEGLPPSPVAEMIMEMRNPQVVETMARVRQLSANGMIRSALEEALYALQFAPTYLPLHVLIGDLLLQDERTMEAIRKYLTITELYTVRGEINRAIRLLKRVCQLMPTDIGVRQHMIELLAAQEKTEDALDEYMNLANLYYNMADLDKARQTYLDALKLAQKSRDNRTWGVNLLLKVADIDMQRLNLRQALRIFEQIRTIQPDNAPTRAQIVDINFRLGQDAAAIKECDEFVVFLENSSRRVQAIEFINDLLIDHPDRPDLRKRLADLFIHNGQIDEAVTQLDTVADALMAENRSMEAINMLETIISLKPANIQEYRNALDKLRRSLLRK